MPLTPPVTSRPAEYDADYIVVGSGAGGGTLAARLAEDGYQVLLLEAGGDPRREIGATPQAPGVNSLPDDYDVPAFHPLATENDGMRWDFFVRHYGDQAQQQRDPAYRRTVAGEEVDGVLYPRAGTLGGCTAHNAMIFLYPHNEDWNQIADLTGDPSWRAEKMRDHFERLEHCDHRPTERVRAHFGANPTRHGWNGWLHTEMALPSEAILHPDLRRTMLAIGQSVLKHPQFALTGDDRRARLDAHMDPNDWTVVTRNDIGLRYTPLTTHKHQRVGTRERLLDVAGRRPPLLRIQLHALVTRVLFDDRQRAIGVEYQQGERLYRAHARPSPAPGTVRQAFAAREVILCGGTFNSPQLLMLSGIGPAAALETHGIAVRADLPGVGQHLQDRYEVAVVSRMNFPSWKSLEGATFTSSDPQYKEWASTRDGVYATNGAMVSVVARSGPSAPSPDLLLYAVIGRFEGYFPGYSSLFAQSPNYLTWVILKAHTNNTAGSVTLRSADPRDRPAINFRYFAEGNDASGEDLRAVAAGVAIARQIGEDLKAQGLVAEETLPGPSVTDAALDEFVKQRAWGHHAAGTCRIGAREHGGVVSSDFSVHGVTGLRVVDASVFPRIPGTFIVSAVYMIGEKAALVIGAAARTMPRIGPVKPFAADTP